MRLGDMCIVTNGGAWSDKEYVECGIPVLKVTNCRTTGFLLDSVSYLSVSAKSKYQKHELHRGDVVIATVGSHYGQGEGAAGRSFVVTSEVDGYYLNQNAVFLRAADESLLNQTYLGYLCKTGEFRHYIGTRGKGAANQMRIPIAAIKDYEVSLPSIHEQRNIASILMAYDNLIENNRRQIALLEEAAQRLYKEWFVDLRFPGYEGAEIVNGVPSAWKKGVLAEVLEVRNGKDHKELPDGSIPVYGSGGVMRLCSASLHEGESVLIPRKGTLNNVMYVNETFWTVDTLFYTHIKLPNGAKYIYEVVRKYDLAAMNIGAAVPSMTKAILNKLDILIPDDTILEQFERLVAPLFVKRDLLRKQINHARESRDRLLPKLMSGEIEVEG